MIGTRQRGRDVGRAANLRPYERWRKGHNLLLRGVVGAFHRAFGNEDPLLARLRSTGLDVADRLLPVKRGFMRLAAGMDGNLPALARPAPDEV